MEFSSLLLTHGETLVSFQMLVSTAAHRIKRTYLFAVLTCGIAESGPTETENFFSKCELNGHPRRIQNNQKTYTNNTKPIHETRQRQKKNHTQLTTSISNKTHNCGSRGSCQSDEFKTGFNFRLPWVNGLAMDTRFKT